MTQNLSRFSSQTFFVLSILVGCLCLSMLVTGAQDEARAAWQISSFDITANVLQSERALAAVTTVGFKNVGRAPGSGLTLRLSSKAKIKSVVVNGASVTFHTLPDARPTLQRVNVTLSSPVAPNNSVSVTFDYRLPVDSNTGLETISPISSQFRPESFWYPVLNTSFTVRGIDTAPFKLKVEGGNAISSGIEKDASSSYDQPLNGQPFFLQGVWDRVEGAGEAKGITAFVVNGAPAEERKQAELMLSEAAAARSFYTSILGAAPNTPIRLVSVRRGGGFGETGTMLIERAAFRRSKLDAGTAMLIAESVARLWFGAQSPIRGEGSAVIREGLTRYLATLFLEKQFGRETSEAELLRERTAYAIVAKRDAPLSRSTPLDDSYYSAVPNKGAMVWRLLERRLGREALMSTVRSLAQNTEQSLSLATVRAALATQGGEPLKKLLDYELDQPTEMDLMVGIPQVRGTESVAALRNLGSIDAQVTVLGTTASGEQVKVEATVPAQNFSEAIFKTNAKLVRVEIDPDKLYPQIDYANDVAPRVRDVGESLAEASRFFGAQDFGRAEAVAREIMTVAPRMQEARILLARALLGQNKLDDAEKIFRATLDDALPTANTIAWANVGLGEIALKKGQGSEAARRFNDAVRTEGEYAASLAARAGRIKSETAPPVDESIRSFVSQMDKDITTGTKADVDARIISGELVRFVNGLVGTKPDIWQTRVLRTEQWDSNLTTADVAINSKVLGKDSSGTAVLIFARVGGSWKLAGVDLFEVR
jgi:tetratricopeptide (TPR) repeat protein